MKGEVFDKWIKKTCAYQQAPHLDFFVGEFLHHPPSTQMYHQCNTYGTEFILTVASHCPSGENAAWSTVVNSRGLLSGLETTFRYAMSNYEWKLQSTTNVYRYKQNNRKTSINLSGYKLVRVAHISLKSNRC